MRKTRRRLELVNGAPAPDFVAISPDHAVHEEPGRVLTVGFIPVRCPDCRGRELRNNGMSRNGLVKYYLCRRCSIAFKAVDVGTR